jgi:CBS domain-containing protein
MKVGAIAVSTVMASPVRTVSADAPLADAYKVLRQHALSSLVVEHRGRHVGVVSRTDLLRVGRVADGAVRRAPLLSLPDKAVRDVMTPGLITVDHGATVSEAARVMVGQRIHRVFVRAAEGDGLAGVISTRDIMEAVAHSGMRAPLSDYMTTPVLTVRGDDTLGFATEKLAESGVAGMVVVDAQEIPVGYFTQVEALQTRDWDAATPVEEAMNLGILCMNLSTPLHRAAAAAAEMRARRVIAVDRRRLHGILTGIDFARAAL